MFTGGNKLVWLGRIAQATFYAAVAVELGKSTLTVYRGVQSVANGNVGGVALIALGLAGVFYSAAALARFRKLVNGEPGPGSQGATSGDGDVSGQPQSGQGGSSGDTAGNPPKPVTTGV